MGTTSLQCRLSPSRSKNSSGAMRTVTMSSPAGAPSTARASARAARRSPALNAARSPGHGAEAVVGGLLLRIAQHVVGLVQFLELIFCIRRLVHVGSGAAAGGAGRTVRKDGRDMGVGIRITLKEAATGEKKEIVSRETPRIS